MRNEISRHVIAGSFDDVKEQLVHSLKGAGFVVSESIDYQKVFFHQLGRRFHKHVLLTADLPGVTSEMLAINPFEGNVLPTTISIIETYPGENIVITHNLTEVVTAHSDEFILNKLAQQIDKRLLTVLDAFAARGPHGSTPDLVTSWG